MASERGFSLRYSSFTSALRFISISFAAMEGACRSVRDQRRFIAAIGVLILIPSALFLASRANSGEFVCVLRGAGTRSRGGGDKHHAP
jgi:hypothetical protein